MSTSKIFLITLLIALAGCDNPKAEVASPDEPATAAQPDESAGSVADDSSSADGTKHDPPIAIEEVPNGHWYCDMGKSHFTREEKGDGKCPVCGMMLKQMNHAMLDHDGHHNDGEHHHN